MRTTCAMYKPLAACAVMLALGASASAVAVIWSEKTSAIWVRNGQRIDLRGERVATDGVADVRLEGRELIGESCVIAAVPGGAEAFGSITVPEEGYLERLAIDGTQLAVARCGATYAKLLIDSRQYDPDAASQNAAGLTLTYVLSTEAR